MAEHLTFNQGVLGSIPRRLTKFFDRLRDDPGVRRHLVPVFGGALERARAKRELAPTEDLRALARFLTSSAQGLSVMAKAAPDRTVLEDVVKVVLAVLEGARPRKGQRKRTRGDAS